MKGDFTRFTFDPSKHYKQVQKQQGRADLDADWNEQGAIQTHLLEQSDQDLIGSFGVPKGHAFEVQPTADAVDLTIQPGHAYVDGLLCVLEGTGAQGTGPVLYTNQPDYVPLGALVPVENQTDLVYLDAWERHITVVEDEQIREPALGGADTTTRVKTVAQVKIRANVGQITCDAPLPDFPPRSRGLLTTDTDPATTTPTSCLLPATGGYRGLENRLYRVEIHTGGDLNTATFKWSRDNGAVVFPIATFLEVTNPSRVRLTRLGRDQLLTIHKNDWVEVTDDQTELRNEPGTLVQVQDIDPQERILVLGGDISQHAASTHPKVRRWDMPDGAIEVDLNAGDPIPLEDGIRVRFAVDGSLTPTGEDFRAGDFWCFTARTGAAGLELLHNVPPRGIRHHYARLALITWKKEGGVFTPDVQSCRKPFPPLTNICAQDVCFDNTHCQLPGATSVQDALNALCMQECCTLTVDPVPGWEAVFTKVPPHGGMICFRPGEYKVTSTLQVKNLGPLVLTGSGEATKLVSSSAECVILFENCGSITIRDLAARAQATGVGGEHEGIRGVFDFRNCWNVTLEGLTLTCANGPQRAAACASVHGNAGRDFQVRVSNCRLDVGVQQTGILAVNAARLLVEGNTIAGRTVPGDQIPNFFTSRVSRAALRTPLISKLFVNAEPLPGSNTNVDVTAGGMRYRFRTTPTLASAWVTLLLNSPPPFGSTAGRAADHVYKLADQLLLNNDNPAFQSVVNQIHSSISSASQGIAVGGTRASDVRIHNNVISGVMQGIHIGLSQHGPRTAANVVRAERIQVTGNTVRLTIAPGATRERHGIFVGNANNAIVRDNLLSLERAPLSQALPVEGVRVFGYLGRLLLVRDNVVDSYTIGIQVTPRGTIPKNVVWRVVDNAILTPSQAPVQASPPVVKTPNFP